MELVLNYHRIYNADMSNGEGVRVTLFVGGCDHACVGCYNQSTWNPDNGIPFTEHTVETIIELMKPDYIDGLSLTGGDPLFKGNLVEMKKLIDRVRAEFGGSKSIWLWTGYTRQEIEEGVDSLMLGRQAIIKHVDVLIDGKFVKELHQPKLLWRGSTNQIIHQMKV